MLFSVNAGKNTKTPPLADFLPFVPKPTATNEVDAALIAWAKAHGQKANG